MPLRDAMNSRPGNPMRENEVNRFKEIQDVFDKFFNRLFGLIAFKTSPIGEALFTARPIFMKVIVLMVVLYYLHWLMGIMLPQRNGIFLTILFFIMMVVASVSSTLVLTIISSLLAWLSFIPWIGVLAFTAYYCYQVLYELVFSAIRVTINQLVNCSKKQGTRLSV